MAWTNVGCGEQVKSVKRILDCEGGGGGDAAAAAALPPEFELAVVGGRSWRPPTEGADKQAVVVEEDIIRCDHLLSTISTSDLAAMIRAGAGRTSHGESDCGDDDASVHYDTADALAAVADATSVAVVNVAFDHEVLKHRGFGHLVPSSEHQPAMGVVWDSCVFPEQNSHRHRQHDDDDEDGGDGGDLAEGDADADGERDSMTTTTTTTRLTVMMGGEHEHMRRFVQRNADGEFDTQATADAAVEVVRPFCAFAMLQRRRVRTRRACVCEPAPAATVTSGCHDCWRLHWWRCC